MRKFTATLKSVTGSDLCFGRPIAETKGDETHDDFERRIWRQKIHSDEDGNCFIPPFALKNLFESSGKWLSMPVPGAGKKTYTKRFVSGMMVSDRMPLYKDGEPIAVDDADPLPLFCPSDGKRGGPRRVMRMFPRFSRWESICVFYALDDLLTSDVVRKHLESGGMFVGFGSMRAENGGVNGRFTVEDLVEEAC